MDEKRRLNSWKEIASYLGFEVRTVQRWEEEKRLPVHRLPGGKRQAVFAYAEELDAWLAGHPLPLQDVPLAGIGSQASPSEFRMPRAAAWWAAGAVVLVVGALALLFLPRFGRASGAEVVRVSFAGEKLIAWDARDREVWSREFPGLLPKAKLNYGTWQKPTERAQLVDLDGDGRREVLAVTHLRRGPSNDDLMQVALHCFDADGKLRWSYEPAASFRFAGQDFGGPWLIHDVLPSTDPRSRGTWLAVIHNTWWPSFVVRVDSNGHGDVRFVSSGVIYTLNLIETARGAYLLAGGVNNEPYAGAMAVLDVNAPPAVSPQDPQGKFHCQNCPTGSPAAYFVFPHSELNVIQESSLNPVRTIRSSAKTLEVRTWETNDAGEPEAMYLFSKDPDIRPTGLNFTDGYWVLHRRLEQEGRLKHPAAQCPDRLHPKPVRMWSPAARWSTFPAPASPSRN